MILNLNFRLPPKPIEHFPIFSSNIHYVIIELNSCYPSKVIPNCTTCDYYSLLKQETWTSLKL